MASEPRRGLARSRHLIHVKCIASTLEGQASSFLPEGLHVSRRPARPGPWGLLSWSPLSSGDPPSRPSPAPASLHSGLLLWPGGFRTFPCTGGRMKAKDTGPPEGASLHRCPHPLSAQPRPPAARAPADRLASPRRPLSPECGSWPKLDLTQLSARPSLPF